MKNALKQLGNNRLLRLGLLTAPCAVLAVSLRNALVLCPVSAIVYAIPALCTAPLRQKLPASLFAVFYSVLTGLVYIPAAILANRICPQITGSIYLPLCCAALCFAEKTDCRAAIRQIPVDIAGSCLMILLLGLLRELLGSGSLMDHVLTEHPPLPVLLRPFAGVILLVLCGAALHSPAEDNDAEEVPQNVPG